MEQAKVIVYPSYLTKGFLAIDFDYYTAYDTRL